MTATVDAEEWLYAILSADATLSTLVNGFFAYVAPDEAEFPFVVFSFVDGSDVNGTGPTRLFSELLYHVRGVDEGESFSGLDAIADAIDALLHGVQGATPDSGYIVDCVRVRPAASVEVADGGIQFRQLGGIYQIRIQEAE